MAWATLIDAANQLVRDTFAPVDPTTGDVVQCTYAPANPLPPPAPSTFLVTLIFVNPLRLEGQNPGNFTLRWGYKLDFDAAGYIPTRGDQVTLEDGVLYRVNLSQADGADGYRLTLIKVE